MTDAATTTRVVVVTALKYDSAYEYDGLLRPVKRQCVKSCPCRAKQLDQLPQLLVYMAEQIESVFLDLTKPFSPIELVAHADRALSRDELLRKVWQFEDDGAGIDPADLPHIFERFYKGRFGQYGLGLAITQAAVQAMRGTVTASNGLAGARFEVCLPL
jgi:signal transduction histidine kinase